jgi:glycerophosphoryl diester phosphodiesterase
MLSMRRWCVCAGTVVALSSSAIGTQPSTGLGFGPGARVLLDAHNAYPDRGRFADRIEQALATGLPVAIEQDLAWCPGGDGVRMAVVSHESECHGGEPTLDAYFFARVAPLLERALASNDKADWPLITLNLDFKTNEPEHHQAVWQLLGRYERFLTSAVRGADPAVVAPLTPGPLLVLTGSNDVQQQTFHDAVPTGSRLRVFGAIHGVAPTDPDGIPRATPATNYRRWWNHPWRVAEPGGQRAAGAWTMEEDSRLRAIVLDAHARGLWVRFYTLNGHDGPRVGWTDSYNFGSATTAEVRWRAAIDAGVDFIATDQYADLARLLPRR